MKIYDSFKIDKVVEENIITKDDFVITEYEIEINANQYQTILYTTPKDLKYLAIGHIFSKGLINSKEDILSYKYDNEKSEIIIGTKKTSSLKIKLDKNPITINRYQLFELISEFENKSIIFKDTGAAHSCALIKNNEIICFFEDVSRSNAVDKLIGYILMNNLDISDKYFLSSCRISKIIFDKLEKIGINTIISVAAVTNEAIKEAKKNNINLIGFARNKRFNVYNRTKTLEIK